MPAHDKPVEEAPEWSPKDWFISAITCDGNVHDSLGTVIHELDRKKKFISAVNAKLCGESREQADQLTLLGKQVKDLENTLRFRLGILRPEREIAWFRKPIHKDFGPFRSTMIMEPVFSQYTPQRQAELKEAIKAAWKNSATGPLPFQDQSENLWRLLLTRNARLNFLASLDGFSQLRLDKLPDGLPADLESRSLRAFLINVRGEFVSIRERLKICFDQLWDASEKFWQCQSEKRVAEAQKAPPHAGTGASHQRGQTEGGQRSKRETAVFLSFAEMEALRFMGFKDQPSAAKLRQRYLEMAKKLHPDQGGNAEAFKMLHKAYKALSKE